jgi:hypothetical protein
MITHPCIRDACLVLAPDGLCRPNAAREGIPTPAATIPRIFLSKSSVSYKSDDKQTILFMSVTVK